MELGILLALVITALAILSSVFFTTEQWPPQGPTGPRLGDQSPSIIDAAATPSKERASPPSPPEPVTGDVIDRAFMMQDSAILGEIDRRPLFYVHNR